MKTFGFVLNFAFLTLIFNFAFLAFNFSSAFADVNCQPIYGGGQTCVQTAIVVNKTVLNPQTNAFVDNLGVNDPKFSPDQKVTFQLTVTNTGNTTLSQVTIKDIFPQFVNFVAGGGKFDSKTKTLTLTIGDLKAGETRVFTVTGKTVSDNQLSQSVTCVVNQAIVTASGVTDASQDNAQLCIQKGLPVTKGGLKVFPAPQVVTTPPTGPEAIGLLALIPSALGGLLLRRRTK